MNDLYLDPVKTIKRLRLESWLNFILPLLVAGLILGLSNELNNLNAGYYTAMTLIQGLLFFGIGVGITLFKFVLIMYLIPVLLYWFEFLVFRVEGNLKKYSYLIALLGPLYATSILIKVILGFLLPSNAFFNFIGLIVPGLAVVYIYSIMILGIRSYFKLNDVRAPMIASIPWLIIFIYSII